MHLIIHALIFPMANIRRLEYKPHLTRWDDVSCEAGSGKHFVYPSRDKLGRPIVMMRPRLEDTKTHESQIRFLIYDLEMASTMADREGEVYQ